MKIIIMCFCSLLIFSTAHAAELIKGKSYRAITNLEVSDGVKNDLKVGAQSKFIVLENDDKDKYAIKFTYVYNYQKILEAALRSEGVFAESRHSDVAIGEIYYLSKSEQNGVLVESRVNLSFGGIVSGPLVVPFKYRVDDKSLGGDATIGYYAGWGFETNFFDYSDQYVTFTPFLSAGLTQITITTQAVDGSSQSDSKSGFTLATGILINNWDGMNIGIVYGQDRIGDQGWSHEGKGWFSMSVGWEL